MITLPATRITTAAMFDPDEALRLGYLDRVLPAHELDAAVRQEALRLRALDLKAYAATKARVNERDMQIATLKMRLDMLEAQIHNLAARK